MAISIKDEYPGMVDVSDLVNYPEGKARNVSAPEDGTGTPWEAKLLNDLLSPGYAMLDAAGITPSGTPESVTTSQIFEAMQKLNGRQIITASATFNTPAWVKRLKVTLVSGGGGGAGSSTTNWGGGGGGAGNAVVFYIDNPAANYAVTVGAGGAGGASGNNAGSAGGASAFGSPAIVTGEGGDGGLPVNLGGYGGDGGSAVTASVPVVYNVRGGHGLNSLEVPNAPDAGGDGGYSMFGAGGRGRGAAAGDAGVSYGSGGGGAGSTPNAGGNGAPGVCIIEWGIGV